MKDQSLNSRNGGAHIKNISSINSKNISNVSHNGVHGAGAIESASKTKNNVNPALI